MKEIRNIYTSNRGIVILPVLAAVLMISLIIVANYQMMISQMGFQSTVDDELALAHQAGNIKEVMNAVDANAAALISAASVNAGAYNPTNPAASTGFLGAAATALNNQLNDGALILDTNTDPSAITPDWSYTPFTVSAASADPSSNWVVPDTAPTLKSHILYKSLEAVYAPVDPSGRPFTMTYNLRNNDSGQVWSNELQYLVYEFSTGDTALTVFGGLDTTEAGTLPITIMGSGGTAPVRGGSTLILGDLKVDPNNTGIHGVTFHNNADSSVKLVSGDLQGIHGLNLDATSRYTTNMYSSGSMPWNKQSFTFKQPGSGAAAAQNTLTALLGGSVDNFSSVTLPMDRQSYRNRAAQGTPNETDFPGRDKWLINDNNSWEKKNNPSNPSSAGGSPIGWPNGPSITNTTNDMFDSKVDLVPVLGTPFVNSAGVDAPYAGSSATAPRIVGKKFAGTAGKYVNLNDFAYSPTDYMYLDGVSNDHIILEIPQRRDEVGAPAPNPKPMVVVCRALKLTIYLAGTTLGGQTLQARPIYLITDAADIRLLTRNWAFNRNENPSAGPLSGTQPMVLWGRLGLFAPSNVYFNRLAQFNGVGQNLVNPLFVTDGVTLLGDETGVRPYYLFNGDNWANPRIVVRDPKYPSSPGLSFADLAERVIYVEAQ